MELTGFYTQKGLELQAELQAAGKPAVVSRVCAGSGTTPAAALALSQERMALTVGTPHRKGAVTALPVTLAEIQAQADFLLTEIGVYVRDADGGEVLCRVYRLGQDLPVTAGGRTVIRLELEEAFGEAAALRAEGTPGGLLTEGDLDALRGVPGGLATLDGAGDVPVGQIPALDYAASSHAGRHGSGGADTVTPAAIGAAASSHEHSAGNITSGTLAIARIPTVTAAKGGTGKTSVTSGSYLVGNGTGAMTEKTPAQVLSHIGAAASGHTHTPADIGAAASSHEHSAGNITSGTFGVARGGTGKASVTSGSYLVGNGTGAMTEKTPAQVLSHIGAAASSHEHSAGNITSGTFGVARGGTGKASVTSGSYLVGNGTGAMTEKTPAQVLSHIGAAPAYSYGTADLTAGVSALATGKLYFVYE